MNGGGGVMTKYSFDSGVVLPYEMLGFAININWNDIEVWLLDHVESKLIRSYILLPGREDNSKRKLT